jgi:hypothetical protein
MNKGDKEKRSEINLNDSNRRPVGFENIDVGMSIAKGAFE